MVIVVDVVVAAFVAVVVVVIAVAQSAPFYSHLMNVGTWAAELCATRTVPKAWGNKKKREKCVAALKRGHGHAHIALAMPCSYRVAYATGQNVMGISEIKLKPKQLQG